MPFKSNKQRRAFFARKLANTVGNDCATSNTQIDAPDKPFTAIIYKRFGKPQRHYFKTQKEADKFVNCRLRSPNVTSAEQGSKTSAFNPKSI